MEQWQLNYERTKLWAKDLVPVFAFFVSEDIYPPYFSSHRFSKFLRFPTPPSAPAPFRFEVLLHSPMLPCTMMLLGAVLKFTLLLASCHLVMAHGVLHVILSHYLSISSFHFGSSHGYSLNCSQVYYGLCSFSLGPTHTTKSVPRRNGRVCFER